MRIVLSRHARQRLFERGVAIEAGDVIARAKDFVVRIESRLK